MLQRLSSREVLHNSDEEPRRGTFAPRGLDIHDLYAFLKSYWRIIAGWTIAAVTLALAYSFTATPLYTASADLRLDSQKVQFAKNNEQVVGDNSLGRWKARSRFCVRTVSRLPWSKSSNLPMIRNFSITSLVCGPSSSAASSALPARRSAIGSRSPISKAILPYVG